MIEYIDNNRPFEDAEERGYRGPGWYFWDETQTDVFGPYKSEEDAKQEELRYAHEVLG